MDELVRRLRKARDAGADLSFELWLLNAWLLTITASFILLVGRATYHLLFVADWSALP